MDENTKESKYLEKIDNDIQEKLWDLLVIHLMDVNKKIKKGGDNQEKLIKLLDGAINELKSFIKDTNKRFIYRYIIILINKILKYDTKRKDLKDYKKELIEDFTKSEEDMSDKIPLNYQINEIRITYDIDYLNYLTKRFIEQKLWVKALYCLIAVRLLEPDNENIDDYYKKIKENMGSKAIEEKRFENPKDMVLALDSNVVISRIFYNVGDFIIHQEGGFDLEKLGNNNKFIITKSVADEVKKHMDFRLDIIKQTCKNYPKFNYQEITTSLKKRYEKIIGKYCCEPVEVSEELIDEINKFYLQYLDKLEEILLQKIQGKYVSQKLRKLAQRKSMLPEDGDIRLLAEVITLNKKMDQEVGILTSDKDFTEFVGGIWKEFGVKVYC